MTVRGFRYYQRVRRSVTAAKGLTIVMYHSVCEQPDDYVISPEAFARQIDFLAHNYRIIRLSNIHAELADERNHDRCVVVTFDDAFSDFLEFAYPVLERASVPCSVFVPTAYIGGTNRWDTDRGAVPIRQVMSADDILRVHNEGLVEFGSHTVDHVSMAHAPYDEMLRQAVDSKRELEALLGVPTSTFAYPYGQLDNYSETTTRVLAEAGYAAAVTTHWGTLNSPGAPLTLRRIHFRESDSAAVLRAKVEGDYDWIAAKERVGFALRRMRGG